MIGPADLADWTYDECDELAAWLRRQDRVHAIVCGADPEAAGVPAPLRPLAQRFARHERLSYDDLSLLARALAPGRRAA